MKSAFNGFFFALPFLVTNLVVALRLEPFYSWLEMFPSVRSNPVLPLALLLLFPVGAYIALQPFFGKSKKESVKKYTLNILVASLLILFFVPVFSALAQELYRCNILLIPNCD